MQTSDKRQFIELLTTTMAAYGKPLPEGAFLKAWWDVLEPFPMEVVRASMLAYRDENGEFAPVPAGIAKRCKVMDGRPSADEAWAISLTSRDEADTVVWTAEMAEAFGLCRSILDMGDEVGARRAFIDAYNRLVTVARQDGVPAKWSVSQGWDMRKREAAITRAQTAGLLPAPVVREMIPYGGQAGVQQEPCPEGLKRVKEELAKLQDAREKMAQRRAAQAEAERQATAARKQEIAEQVAQYGSPV